MDADQVSQLDAEAFEERFGGVFESSPWVARVAYANRPWASLDELHAAMVAVVESATHAQQLELLQAHPDLAARAERPTLLTAESQAEQAAAGLDDVDEERAQRLAALNGAYSTRFGFPFIVCAREHTPESILEQAKERLTNTDEDEHRTALGEVYKIARLRLANLVTAPVAAR